ncbi:MAG: hypothetical protein Q8930_20135 [Bacillota bacterium]|nr:hypothetical protein [Bacillota bacterium]
MIKDYIIMALVILAVIILVVSLVKKAVKLVLIILAVFIGIGVYNIVVKGRSPVDVVNDYVTNFKYGRNVAGLTGKINTSTGNIKKIIEANSLDKNSVEVLKQENENLHKYKDEFESLKHTEVLNGFHKNYSGYLDTIVGLADNAVKLSANGTLEGAKDMAGKIKGALDSLVSLKQ